MNDINSSVGSWRDKLDELLPGGRLVSVVLTVIGIYILICVIVGMYWSITPKHFDVRERAAAYAAAGGGTVVTGSVTTAALIGVMDTLLTKPGGYTHNDIFPPGIWLDNMPNWEYGVLIQSRDLARALRENFSRSQSQSTEDVDLVMAEPRFNFASESEYKDGVKYVRRYFDRLSDPGAADAQFYARADNLRNWLTTVNTRLGSLSQRLSASVGKRRINTDLAGEESASQSTNAPQELDVTTPWMEIDDVFYEARGTAWALIEFLEAAEVDFADVLSKKNAQVSLQQIIRELEGTQETVWSPMILNGSGFGVLANHSLVMASYISRANAAIIDLRDLLSQG